MVIDGNKQRRLFLKKTRMKEVDEFDDLFKGIDPDLGGGGGGGAKPPLKPKGKDGTIEEEELEDPPIHEEEDEEEPGKNPDEEEEEDQEDEDEEEEDNDDDPSKKKPKGEDEDDEEEEEDNVATSIGKAAYQFPDDWDKEYEDSTEGLVEYFKDALEHSKKDAILEELNNNPLLKEFKEHIDQGNSVDTFKLVAQQIDYGKLKEQINEKTEPATLKNIIIQDLRDSGMSDTRIAVMIESFEEKETLQEEAKNSLDSLSLRQETVIKAKIKEEQDAYQLRLKEQKEYEDAYKKIVSAGDIAGIKLDAKKKKSLLDFTSVPVKEGKTAKDLKIENLTVEQEAILDYILMNDFKIPGLTIKTDKKLANLRDLSGKESRVDSGKKKKRRGRTTEVNYDDLPGIGSLTGMN